MGLPGPLPLPLALAQALPATRSTGRGGVGWGAPGGPQTFPGPGRPGRGPGREPGGWGGCGGGAAGSPRGRLGRFRRHFPPRAGPGRARRGAPGWGPGGRRADGGAAGGAATAEARPPARPPCSGRRSPPSPTPARSGGAGGRRAAHHLPGPLRSSPADPPTHLSRCHRAPRPASRRVSPSRASSATSASPQLRPPRRCCCRSAPARSPRRTGRGGADASPLTSGARPRARFRPPGGRGREGGVASGGKGGGSFQGPGWGAVVCK